MKRKFDLLAIAIITMLASCKKEMPNCKGDESDNKVTVFATGLNNPRGLKFGPDGRLYVAEGGIGGKDSTVKICPTLQVPFPVGPYVGSRNGGRISWIDEHGMRTTITDKFPSSKGNELVGGDIQGVADIAFKGNMLYALLAGAGCSHGVPNVPNGIARVNMNGTWNLFANLSLWLQTHPVAHPEADDFEPDGTPYSMVQVDDNFFVVEPNHGDFIRVGGAFDIKRVLDISASQGHIVPTSVTYHKGYFYIGNLNTFPIVQGSAKVFKISPSGQLQVFATGFTTITGLVFDDEDRLYVLENTTNNPYPTPGTGKVIRVNTNGAKQTIASGLSLPTGITFGPDKKLYVSNVGFGPTSIGGGQVLKITLGNCKCDGAAFVLPKKL